MKTIYKQIKSYAENRLKIQLSDELLNKIANICKVKKHKKGDLLITAGEVVSVSYFVLSGLVRTFYIDIDGNEVTNYFVFENRFFGGSYITIDKPIRYNFEALEDCATLEFDRSNIAEIIRTEQEFLLIYISILEDIRYKGWFRKPYFISRQRLIRSGLEQFCGKEDFMSGQSIYRDCAA